MLGQHTVEVCTEILHMSEEEIAALTAAGVLEE
jgi:crotonobetainyl-CoA:carnitine CoA-transferase CaiB-like acyl-CoA transferase